MERKRNGWKNEAGVGPKGKQNNFLILSICGRTHVGFHRWTRNVGFDAPFLAMIIFSQGENAL